MRRFATPAHHADQKWRARETLGLAKTRGSNLELMGGKAKHLVLLGPCGGQVGEAGNAHAMRKATVHRRLDEIGREERKRDRHIDLADAAPLAFGNCFGVAIPLVASSSSQR